MKVLMRSTMAGPNGTHLAGKTADLPTEQANDLIRRGYAIVPKRPEPEPDDDPDDDPEEDDDVNAPETADATPAPSTAEARRAKPKKRGGRKPPPA